MGKNQQLSKMVTFNIVAKNFYDWLKWQLQGQLLLEHIQEGQLTSFLYTELVIRSDTKTHVWPYNHPISGWFENFKKKIPNTKKLLSHKKHQLLGLKKVRPNKDPFLGCKRLFDLIATHFRKKTLYAHSNAFDHSRSFYDLKWLSILMEI